MDIGELNTIRTSTTRRGKASLLRLGLLPAAVMLMAPAGVTAVVHNNVYLNVEVHNVGSTADSIVIPVESDYLPNVVQAENGAASLEALKAQAVAARSYLYYKLNNQGWISDGTEDQVYTPGGSSTPGGSAPTANQLLAVSSTAWEILRFRDTQVCAFYVAGTRPSTSGTAMYGVAEAGDTPSSTTESYVTYNRGAAWGGTGYHQTTLGWVNSGNYANRGAKSQNGADFLSDNGWNYVDILRFYYGADIRLEMAKIPSSGEKPPVKTIAAFDVDQGYFGNNYDSPRNMNVASALRSRTTAGAHSGSGAQRIAITSGAGGFTYFNVSGLGPNSIQRLDGVTPGDMIPGTADTNLIMESVGAVGVWLKADVTTGSPNAAVALLLDDEAGGTEISLTRSIPADGAWHEYRWLLGDELVWDNYSGGNGKIDGPYFSIDSFRFTGLSDVILTMDDVYYDASVVPEPASLSLVMLGALALRRKRGDAN